MSRRSLRARMARYQHEHGLVGSRIAHYDVTALIGEGGMGRVYQATDTKLNRRWRSRFSRRRLRTTHRTYGVRNHVCREPTTVNTSIELLDTTTWVLAERPEPTGKMAPCERSGSGWPGPFSSCH